MIADYEVIVPGKPETYREGLTLDWAKVEARKLASDHAAAAVISLGFLIVMTVPPEGGRCSAWFAKGLDTVRCENDATMNYRWSTDRPSHCCEECKPRLAAGADRLCTTVAFWPLAVTI